MRSIKKVLVVGGGIAGLTLAVALRRRNIDADIVELQPKWNVLGVGISLTGPTLRALKSIGLIDQCVAVAFGFDRIVFADSAGASSARSTCRGSAVRNIRRRWRLPGPRCTMC